MNTGNTHSKLQPSLSPVISESFAFQSGGLTLRGDLYLPQSQSSAVVIVTGAWTTIKEHMAGLYAAKLAERGLAALAFDFRTWGASEGETLSLEDPEMKIEDILAAAEALRDDARFTEVYGLGICASAGYMATACARSDKISKLALVAAWLHDRDIVESVYGGSEAVASLIQASRDAAEKEHKTGEPCLIPAAGAPDSGALMPMKSYYTDPERGFLDHWQNSFNLRSWEAWLTFDAQAAAAQITQPTLFVHSEAAAIPQGVRQFYGKLNASKRQVWVNDQSQFDFYDQAYAVETALDAVLDHFNSQRPCPQQAALTITMQAFLNAIDRNDFKAIEAMLENQIHVDYSSLWGGQAELVERSTLLENWANVLPGFDQTHHDLSNFEVSINESVANLKCAVVGQHWLNGQIWSVAGYYETQFTHVQDSDQWKLNSLKLTVQWEDGDRSLFDEAQANIKK